MAANYMKAYVSLRESILRIMEENPHHWRTALNDALNESDAAGATSDSPE